MTRVAAFLVRDAGLDDSKCTSGFAAGSAIFVVVMKLRADEEWGGYELLCMYYQAS